jgi:hypothetical protein
MCRLATLLLLLLFSGLLPATSLYKPKPQVPGRDYNIEYRIEWSWEKGKPQVVYEWFWMPDSKYPGQ